MWPITSAFLLVMPTHKASWFLDSWPDLADISPTAVHAYYFLQPKVMKPVLVSHRLSDWMVWCGLYLSYCCVVWLRFLSNPAPAPDRFEDANPTKAGSGRISKIEIQYVLFMPLPNVVWPVSYCCCSVRPCVHSCVHPETLAQYLAERVTHFHQTYVNDGLWDRWKRCSLGVKSSRSRWSKVCWKQHFLDLLTRCLEKF